MSVRADTPEAAFRVFTFASSAQQGVPLTLVDVHAVFHHHEATLVTFETLAFKISWRVDAPALSTQVGRDAALVDVSAVPLVRVQSIAIITATTEAADGVSAPPVCAQGVYHPAFIYIFEEGSAIDEVPPMREARATRTQLGIL